MKHPLIVGSVVVAVTSLSQFSHADFLGVYAGASIWQSAASGEVQDGSTLIDVEDDLGINDEDANVFYVAFEHPVPVLPNIRVQHIDLSIAGESILTRAIEFDGVSYDVDEPVNSFADLTHTDATLYWELWDTIGELDLGITARMYDGSVSIESATSGQASEDFDAPVPMVYAKVGVKLPFTGLNASVTANAIDYSDYQLFDASASLNYEASFGLGAEIGYRVMELDVDDEDIQADISIDGFFAGVTYHF